MNSITDVVSAVDRHSQLFQGLGSCLSTTLSHFWEFLACARSPGFSQKTDNVSIYLGASSSGALAYN